MAHATRLHERIGGRSSSFPLRFTFTILLLAVVGCGGGSPQSSSGGGQPPPPPFQPRPFPGDYFMRLPTQDGLGGAPDAVYDPSLKEVFVSNSDMNTVDAYSTVDGHHVGEIGVPGPAGLSLSPDYSELVIGTITPYIYLADPTKLHVTTQIQIPASQLITDQVGNTLMPVIPCAMADGSIFLGMGVTPESLAAASLTVSHLVKYDPTAQSFTSEDSGAGGQYANPARSGDGKWLIVVDSQGVSLYSVSAGQYVATASGVQGQSILVAANADGSQFATIGSQITFWSNTLSLENSASLPVLVDGEAPLFSRDGKYLYVMTQNNLYALNAQSGTPAGYLGVTIPSPITIVPICDVDENYHIFAATLTGGLAVINASPLQATAPANVPDFTLPSTNANPNTGPIAGGTPVQFIPAPNGSGASDGIPSSMEAYFGSVPATNDVVGPYPASSDGENFLTATAPAAANAGPVSVILTDASNNRVFLPDAYTYGPKLLRVTPNAVSPAGGTAGGGQITIFGYGFGFDPNGTSISVEGTALGMGAGVLNAYASAYYPEQSITVGAPVGNPGWADVAITTGNGTDTIHRGVQYLQAEANLGGGPFNFAVYDSVTSEFYVTGNGNSVAVFDPGSQTMSTPLQSGAVSSGATLESEAVTPDGSSLLVSDPTDGLVVIFNLSSGTSTAVKVLLPSDPAVTLTAPMSVVAAANNRAFVSLSPCIPDPVREIDLTTFNVQTRPDAAANCPAYVPYPQLGGASTDGSTIIFAGNNQEEPPGPEYVWRYDASSDTFQGPSLIGDRPWLSGDGAANKDGSVIALSQGTLDQRLLPLAPMNQFGSDSRLNETGSLIYGDSEDGPITLSDTHNGRVLLSISMVSSPAIGFPDRPLAIDPTGQQILIATQAGISYFKLSVVPLAVGTVSPAQGAAGTMITINGSGFVSGTAVQIGGQSASCSDIDTENISCTVPNLAAGATSIALSNPDGQTYSYENAFTVQ